MKLVSALFAVLFLAASTMALFGQSFDDTLHDYYPSGAKFEFGDTLYVIENGAMNDAERMMILTLAGIVAQDKPAIFVRIGGSYDIWLEELEFEYGLELSAAFRHDPWGLVSHFTKSLTESSYVLYNLGESSTNVAISLAGIWKAAAIDESIEAKAQDAGLILKMDVRGKDEEWCFQNYWDQFNHSILIQQKEEMFGLRDYGPAARAFSFFDGNSAFMQEVMQAADDDSPILGWGDASQGEDKFVKPGSQQSIFTIPADHAWNLSVFSAIQLDSLVQQTHTPEEESTPAVHTVTFVMSDGDNIQWMMNDFSSNERWYGSPLRGQFSMGWTIPPSMADLAPSIMNHLYDFAETGAHKDFFVAGVSGGGYMYPSQYPELGTHCERLNGFLKKADLNIVTILERERGFFTPEILDNYTRQPNVIGCFYLDYAQYDYYGGKIVWSQGKPVVSAKFNLWDGFDSPSYIAQNINRMTTDPALSSSYSYISVHPWSKSLDDVQQTINSFNSKIDVVTPDIFMQRIMANVPHDPAAIGRYKSTNPVQEFDLAVYPNPTGSASSMVTLHVRGIDHALLHSIRVVDILGRTVREWRPTSVQESLSWTYQWDAHSAAGVPAPAGVYFLQSIGRTLVQSQKFIIMR